MVDRQKTVGKLINLSAVERWFVKSTDKGSRNNNLLRYGLMLVDAGNSLDEVNDKIIALNSKLPDSLDVSEIYGTVFRSVAKAISKRSSE